MTSNGTPQPLTDRQAESMFQKLLFCLRISSQNGFQLNPHDCLQLHHEVRCWGGVKFRGQIYPGVRCTGAIKHCYCPKGSTDEDYYPTTCRDKSDRVFQVGEPCPNSDNNCWESCDKPGHGCSAGTNTTYFRLQMSTIQSMHSPFYNVIWEKMKISINVQL